MTLSDIAVRRPIATVTLFLAAMLLGAISFSRLEVTLFPELEATELAIWVPYPEAGIHEIEESVARPIEESIVTVHGVSGIRASIVSGGVSFDVRLHAGADPDLVTLGIRERLDAARWSLPDGVERPVILGTSDLDRPTMVLALASSDLPAAAEWAEDVLRPRLEEIDGVARAAVVGGPNREIRIDVDPVRQRAFGISTEAIARTLEEANVQAPGGYLRRREIHFALHVESRLASTQDIADLVIARNGDRAIRVSDVARVTDTFEEARGFSRLDGRPAVGILLAREGGANIVRMAGDVRERLEAIRAEFPEFDVTIVSDSSPFVRQSMSGLWQAVWIGGLLAYLVLVLFLRDVRSPLLVILAQPVSVVISCAVLDLLHVSLNLMSLGGIALGAGMLIDNSIICLENIHRHRAEGKSAVRAAAIGAREVAVPIIGSTLTTCAVFGPLAWVPGALGDLFRDQALAVSVSLGVSILVSLTLLPALAARVRTSAASSHWMPLHAPYHRLLVWFLDHRRIVLGATAVAMLFSGVALVGLPREILPEVDTENVEIDLELPPGTDIAVTGRAAREIEVWLDGRPEVERVLASVGAADEFDPSRKNREAHRATVRARLYDDAVSRRKALVDALRVTFGVRPGWRLTFVSDRPELALLFPESEAALTCDLAGPDPRRAEELARRIAGDAARYLTDSSHPLELAATGTEPRLRLTAREDALDRYGVTEREALHGVGAGASGREATKLRRFDDEDPVVVHADASPRDMFTDLVVSGRPFPVRALFEVTAELAPAELLREDQARVASIRWNGPLRDVTSARGALERALVEGPLPKGYTAQFRGMHGELRRVIDAIVRSFAIAAALVLLVLAAEFESVRLPLVVFSAVPLGIIGVTIALLLTGGSINAISGMGLVILIGIVDNDAILKVDLIRRFLGEGMTTREAILAASRQRYRPIILTTATTVLALVPLAFGRGASLRSPMALTVTGGLLAATVLTLLVLPVLLEAIVGPRRRAVSQEVA